ncbi:MAG TPA: SRPBCC family protein [Thermohalobaculum sp.]|nr:SRPBCC family protein [Thermohalobaculum sp.]
MAQNTTDPILQLQRTSARPFEDARAMPPGVYTSEAFLARELETMFRHDWICVGRASAMAKPGDYVTCDIAGQPVMVVRGRDGALRAMANVCLHRMSTLLEGAGNVRTITCPYHAWTYNLDGTLRAAPRMERNTGFCKDKLRLPTVRCEEWLGWVYVTLNAEAEAIATRLAPLEVLIGHFGIENYTETFRETHVWDTNWKILAENYMESYHLPICHRATVGPYTGLGEVDCPPGDPAFNIHWFPKDEGLALGNAHPANTRLTGKQRKTSALISIYPSHLVTLTPGYFWYLSLQPMGTGKVNMILGGGFAPDFIADPKAAEYDTELQSLLHAVNIEDRGCTEAVYRGVSAGLSQPGPLSHLERPVYDFSRYLASRTGRQA